MFTGAQSLWNGSSLIGALGTLRLLQSETTASATYRREYVARSSKGIRVHHLWEAWQQATCMVARAGSWAISFSSANNNHFQFSLCDSGCWLSSNRNWLTSAGRVFLMTWLVSVQTEQPTVALCECLPLGHWHSACFIDAALKPAKSLVMSEDPCGYFPKSPSPSRLTTKCSAWSSAQ